MYGELGIRYGRWLYLYYVTVDGEISQLAIQDDFKGMVDHIDCRSDISHAMIVRWLIRVAVLLLATVATVARASLLDEVDVGGLFIVFFNNVSLHPKQNSMATLRWM